MSLRPRRVHLVPPVSYQGGKRRQAPEIVRHMALDPEQPFFELCAGSGAVSLELISRGHNPAKITMVDAGPWGDVWRLVGAGEFDCGTLLRMADGIADDDVPSRLRELAAAFPPGHPSSVYAFLLLQSASFGGKAVCERDGRWVVPSFCKARQVDGYDVRPWNPAPAVMAARMGEILRFATGVRGVRADISRLPPPEHPCVIYIDPPYAGAAGYAHRLDASDVAARYSPNRVFVSERMPLSSRALGITPRRRSNVSALGNAPIAEYLSLFNADWPTEDVEKFENAELFA